MIHFTCFGCAQLRRHGAIDDNDDIGVDGDEAVKLEAHESARLAELLRQGRHAEYDEQLAEIRQLVADARQDERDLDRERRSLP